MITLIEKNFQVTWFWNYNIDAHFALDKPVFVCKRLGLEDSSQLKNYLSLDLGLRCYCILPSHYHLVYHLRKERFWIMSITNVMNIPLACISLSDNTHRDDGPIVAIWLQLPPHPMSSKKLFVMPIWSHAIIPYKEQGALINIKGMYIMTKLKFGRVFTLHN